MNSKTISKAMSKALRHDPGFLGIKLDDAGWASTGELYTALIEKFNLTTVQFGPEDLHAIVDDNDKQRFGWNEDRTKIRANQGHSIEIDLELEPKQAPETLYHGTALHTRPAIMEKGLLKMNRQHVHLSADEVTAAKVGSRHGKPTVFNVRARQHQEETGAVYFLSKNGVWLTDFVPPTYLD